ncbi:MAG: hypothetical protein H0T60_11085 [Acidobacteria bacterium]|nr:hypothetical protein [Acidobacteriota bacterium]
MILQSKDKFSELARLNLDTGEVAFVSKHSDPALKKSVPSGGYSIVNGVMCSLYKVGGGLYLRVGEQAFEITDDVKATLNRSAKKHTFQLLRNENLLLEFIYPPPKLDIPLADDPTPFIEEEDFDFLLFVTNVLNDKGRRQRVYNQAL